MIKAYPAQIEFTLRLTPYAFHLAYILRVGIFVDLHKKCEKSNYWRDIRLNPYTSSGHPAPPDKNSS